MPLRCTRPASAKTVKNLPRRADGEGGRFLLVEGTQALEILPGSSQRHMLAHDFRDVHSVSDLVDDVVRNQALAHGGPR